jgi:probable HAF family extracellular repeat protein
MRNLQSVLETDYGMDLTGWQLTSAVDVSDDGLVIAGNGINPLGQQEGWVVRLEAIPEPATLVLFALGACGILVWRSKRAGRMMRHPRAMKLLWLATVAGLVLAGVGESRAAEFSGVGFLGAADNVNYVESLSRDGSVVGGLSFREYTIECPDHGPEFHWSYRRGYLWSAQDGMRALDPDADVNQLGYDEIYDVATGGAAVFGGSFGTLQYFCGTQAGSYDARGNFSWTPTGGFEQQPARWLEAFGGDHTIYTGAQSVASIYGATKAFRESAGETELLGWLPWGNHGISDFRGPYSRGTGISADGRVVVGNSTSAAAYDVDLTFGAVQYSTEAFRWVEGVGMVGLGDLPGGDFGSEANAVSGDGQVVIGRSAVASGSAAFLWTAETGMVEIGGLLPGGFSIVNAVSFDGSIIVGSSATNDEFDRAAIIWDEQNGVRNLKDVLQSDYGLNLTGWTLIDAVDISDDGQVIAGNGINPLGQSEGWVVRLEAVPEPATVVLFLVGACAIAVWRRRNLAHCLSQR